MPTADPPRRYRPAELTGLLLDPGWADDAGADCLVVDLAAQAPDARDLHELTSRLRVLPVPVVGIGAQAAGPLADAMDVLVESAPELSAVLDAVGANPDAAAVLVQVLRSVGKLPVLEALTLESLAYATLQSGTEFARWLAGRKSRAPRGPADGATPAQRGTAEANDVGSGLRSPSDPILLERRGSRLEIVLNAVHNRNALSTAMRDALTDAFKLAAMDPGITRVDMRANGPSFSAGGDLTEFGTTSDGALAHRIRTHRMPARYLAPEGGRYHVHVHGACIGAGIELAAFAAHLTAAQDAFFRLPEVSMGLIPGAGGCVSIPRRIGRQRTAFLALTGRQIDVHQALAWGLVDGVAE